MKCVKFTDDLSATADQAVKMTCDCGWKEKAWATREARDQAERHLKDAHTYGMLMYQGHSYTVGPVPE